MMALLSIQSFTQTESIRSSFGCTAREWPKWLVYWFRVALFLCPPLHPSLLASPSSSALEIRKTARDGAEVSLTPRGTGGQEAVQTPLQLPRELERDSKVYALLDTDTILSGPVEGGDTQIQLRFGQRLQEEREMNVTCGQGPLGQFNVLLLLSLRPTIQ